MSAKFIQDTIILKEKSQNINKYISNKKFFFENNKSIPNLELVYETYGTLNQDKSNVIIVHHSLSVGSHLARHDYNNNEDRGWWDDFVGPNKALDTNKYFIICINNIGSCFGSSGPSLYSINPETKKPYLLDFPEFSFKDIVISQMELLDFLGIKKVYAMLGSSMGGMISLTWLKIKPSMIENLFLCATAYKSYPFNTANRMVQKEAILNDPEYHNGFYSRQPKNSLKLARKIGLLFYRGIPDLNLKFPNHDRDNLENIYSYYEYNADKFARYFDANSYIYTLNCMDRYDLSLDITDKKNTTIFPKSNTKIFLTSIDSDLLFPEYQQEELYIELKKSFKNITYIKHKTPYGHDSFFIEYDIYKNYIVDLLS